MTLSALAKHSARLLLFHFVTISPTAQFGLPSQDSPKIEQQTPRQMNALRCLVFLFFTFHSQMCLQHACKAWLAPFVDHWKGAYWASATFRLLFAQAENVSECSFAIPHLDHSSLPCFRIYCINEHCRMFFALFHGCTRPL
ncbi:hypothetical protein EV421DRAFT_973203 [Armillaria borealis]|uniref:Secreted protein n=1 Tax=Armillaria borealis TaxID=47425 RepID=A0AA39J8R9_9AGAR|nr:hypothetical protein EV421DRAFT_973203 [Armillaria borealis]